MNIFRQLLEKPWEGQNKLAGMSGQSFNLPAASVGLRLFLCIATVLFTLMIAAYAERMVFEDWRPTPPQWLLWVNTVLLIQSSLLMQWAWNNLRRERLDNAKTGLLAAGLFAVSFLVGQVVAWWQLTQTLAFEITNPAIAFFYMITALHALHLLGGLVAWGMTMSALWRERDMNRVALQLRLCTTYWHFLLILWLVLFGLLFSGRDTLTTLLAIFGLR